MSSAPFPVRMRAFDHRQVPRDLPSSTVLLTEVVTDASIAARMQLRPEDELVHLRRIRLVDEEPMALEDAYVPTRVLGIEQVNGAASLDEQLAKSGYLPRQAEQTISATIPSDEDRALLNVESDVAAITVERIVSTEADEIVEYTRTLYRADQYHLDFVVEREPQYDQHGVTC